LTLPGLYAILGHGPRRGVVVRSRFVTQQGNGRARTFDDPISVADMQILPGMIWRGYLVGSVPALVTALMDWLLRRNSFSRVLLTALSGYVLASGAGLLMRDVSVFGALQFGLVGAIPAAVFGAVGRKEK
jgi:hypothetical protein